MTTTSESAAPTRLTWRDHVRLWRWMAQFGAAMQDYPSREVRRLRRELRASVLDDASRIGLDDALRELGSPRRLAAAYFAELDRERPRWTDGAVLGGLIGLLLPAYMWLGWQIGALDAIGAMGGGEVELSWLGSPMRFHHADDRLFVEGTITWGPVALAVGLGVLFFALGSRIWRLWR